MSPSRKKLCAQQKQQNSGDLTIEEEELLESFCREFEHTEISFDEWCHHHDSLDLEVKITISEKEAKKGGRREISWSQNIVVDTGTQLKQQSRKKRSMMVEFPQGIKDGHAIELKGLGDKINDRTGNLLVIIKIR